MRGLTVLAGVLLLAAPATGLWVDVGNNWQYGLTVSHEAAIVLAAAAVGVAGFPALAGMRGWNGLLASCWAVCFVLTVGAAFLAYTGKQGQTADQRKAAAEAYQSARQDEAAAREEEKAARDEAAAVGETGTVEELQALADRAEQTASDQATAAKAANVLCPAVKRCRQADEALTLATRRLGEAKAKAAALERAEAARERIQKAVEQAKAGPASSPLSAMWIAARGGWQADEVAASIDVGLAVLIIAVTQLFAVMAHPAVALIVGGLAVPARPSDIDEPSAPVHQLAGLPVAEQTKLLEQHFAPARQRTDAPARKRAARTAPAGNIAVVQAWADQALVARSGVAVQASDVFAAFQAQAASPLTQAAFGAAMAGAGFRKEKLGGKVVYVGVAFRQALRLASGG
jgi:hypothetical protein